jgi:hypothetical protein
MNGVKIQDEVNSDNISKNKLELLKKFTLSFDSKKMVKKFSEKEIVLKIKFSACKNMIKMLNNYFPQLPGLSKIKKLKQISQSFIRNSKTKIDSELFNKKLDEFLTYDFGDKNRKGLENNINIVNYIKSQHPSENMLQKTLKEVFQIYFESDYYYQELECIKKEEHYYFYERFKEISIKFLNEITHKYE